MKFYKKQVYDWLIYLALSVFIIVFAYGTSLKFSLKDLDKVFRVQSSVYRAFSWADFEREVNLDDLVFFEVPKANFKNRVSYILDLKTDSKSYIDKVKFKNAKYRELIFVIILGVISIFGLMHHHSKNWVRGV